MGIRFPILFLFVMSRTLGHSAELSALSQAIDPDWIAQALATTGKASIRKRKLPAEQVVWLVIALALYRHQSIPEVVAHLDLVLPDEVNADIAKSALTQARQRLGQAPLAQLFAMSASCWDERHQSGRAWRGLCRYAVDGSTLRTSDSPENRAHFGAQAYASGVVASYPQLRLLTLTALATHLVRDAVFGAYGTNEMLYAKSLLDRVPDHSLTVFDKGFFSASLLLQLQTKGHERHWLIPAKANSTWERLDPHPTDYRVRMKVSPQARQAEPDLPAFWEVRAIETTTSHGKKRILLTSLMDRQTYPASEIVHQYEERWRIETSYRELKQELLGSELTLRSGTPETVYQEVWGALLAYNLVRLEMAEVATEAQVEPTRLSFITALHYLRHEWGWMAIEAPGKIPAHLTRLRNRLADLLLTEKRGRSCPVSSKNCLPDTR
ncbi:IS4 family transposase [Rhizobium sp. T1470]|uniref:Transposase is4 family protein n=1 Tax=Rhizobium favelukesii TaxID=348824 RepID=W6R5G7_9HYPH|nr:MULTISPECIES: IS4 family transposase [Rhizobium]MCA0803995.1 IS4 family transposase [Rhizobium sp. T1473]UFS81615.1 IS4 family transposase [Rhizobium sp. T136]UFS82123.1 IS4 family transposase [Rhizobium sp. T136]CDM56204.1 transposase is4 family protein [Rhizobium favelukesii]CDM56744.1 transposase is4 family protein [Rhizobium favelukesii]